MTYDPWTTAIKEAYATAPAGVVILPTLEIRHPSFIEEGNPVAIRVVADQADLIAKLEAEAPFEAGQTVTFTRGAFEIKLPESTERVPELVIAVDGVSAIIDRYLDAAVDSTDAIEVSYREYIAANAQVGPEYFIHDLYLGRVVSNVFRVEGSARFFDLANRNFPNQIYTTERFPGLRR